METEERKSYSVITGNGRVMSLNGGIRRFTLSQGGQPKRGQYTRFYRGRMLSSL